MLSRGVPPVLLPCVNFEDLGFHPSTPCEAHESQFRWGTQPAYKVARVPVLAPRLC